MFGIKVSRIRFPILNQYFSSGVSPSRRYCVCLRQRRLRAAPGRPQGRPAQAVLLRQPRTEGGQDLFSAGRVSNHCQPGLLPTAHSRRHTHDRPAEALQWRFHCHGAHMLGHPQRPSDRAWVGRDHPRGESQQRGLEQICPRQILMFGRIGL